MMGTSASDGLLANLNDATAREMQVSMQYMMQHTLYSGRKTPLKNKPLNSRTENFVASHSPVYLPGKTLKKIAITEMRHAEAIAERVSNLGGEPVTQPRPFRIGGTLREIVEIDKNEEEAAIALYNRIIAEAKVEGDTVTEKLFKRILLDEEGHHRVFVELLKETVLKESMQGGK